MSKEKSTHDVETKAETNRDNRLALKTRPMRVRILSDGTVITNSEYMEYMALLE